MILTYSHFRQIFQHEIKGYLYPGFLQKTFVKLFKLANFDVYPHIQMNCSLGSHNDDAISRVAKSL